ncbi:endosialin-like [Gadus macrocephalus]|uniref:endosialin-like n=1 Tax=Gadus macrocephalus TaxID=80720 RepID=UPI0028CB33C4|nr:endosialin-like [Gadus macrocephalus]
MYLPWMLLLLCAYGAPAARGQATDEAPRPGDTLCHAERGCYAVFVQRKTFREAGRSCREHGGTLATLHSDAAADAVHRLLASMEPRGARARLRLWMGLHRAPRQCSSTRPLRGFVWVTGDQEGKYTNWLREEAPGACLGPRCVALTVPASESARDGGGGDHFRWLDGACGLSLDGFVCQYHFKGMCPPLEPEAGGEPPRYTTPFRLTSALLTHVPFGSVAVAAPCPADADAARPGGPAERTALCVEREDGGVGWSAALPLCSPPRGEEMEDQEDREDPDFCQGDHGCEHHCQLTRSDYACFCSVGFTLDEDGYGCNPDDDGGTTPAPTDGWDHPETSSPPPRADPACVAAGCQYDCVEAARGVRCTCPPGYQVGRDGRGCADVDECAQRPCLQQCVNSPGTFHCACYPGYGPDEEGECVDVDECLDEATCRGGCRNTEGSYSCRCDRGYEQGSGGECQDVDECERESPCQQRCLNFVGRFVCFCENGYTLRPDGVTCEAFPEDEEYSTLTPDPEDGAPEPDHAAYTPPDEADPGRGRPWLSSYTPDPGFDSDWLTEPPGETSPDVAPPRGSDGHLDQWEGRSPRPHHTAPPPTQPRSDAGETGAGGDAGDGADAGVEVPNQPGSHPGAVAKVGGGSGGGMRDGASAGGRGEAAQAGEDSGEAESAAGKRKHDKSWLLVALLVPLCVFLVVMLALGIVYCTSCAVDKSHRLSDCYRWLLPAATPAATPTSNGKPQA